MQTISSVAPTLASHPLTIRNKATSLPLSLPTKKAQAPWRFPDTSVPSLPTKVLSHLLLSAILKLNSKELTNRHTPHALSQEAEACPSWEASSCSRTQRRMAHALHDSGLFILAESSDLTMMDSKVGKSFRRALALSEVTKLVQPRTPVHSSLSLKPSLSPLE